MISSHAACLVRRWVSLYTHGLPPPVRDRRREEVAGDLWSQVEESRELGRGDAATAGEMVVRLLAGLPADVSWRLEKRGQARMESGRPRAGTSGTPVVGVLAIAGGTLLIAALLTMLLTLPTMGPTRPWADPVIGMVLVITSSGGMIALALATFGLVIRYQDRLRGIVAATGAFGFLAGFLAALGPYQLFGVLAVCAAVLAVELASLGVLDRRLAGSHVAAATAFLTIVVAGSGGVSVGTLGMLVLPYPITWVVIGGSLIRGWSGAPAPQG